MSVLHKVKMKLSKDGTVGISGTERYGNQKNIVIADNMDILQYLQITNEGFSFQTKNSVEVFSVFFNDLSDNPSVPIRLLWKNGISANSSLIFLYDLIAEISYAGADKKGNPNEHTLEYLKSKYRECEGLDLKAVGRVVLSNI